MRSIGNISVSKFKNFLHVHFHWWALARNLPTVPDNVYQSRFIILRYF